MAGHTKGPWVIRRDIDGLTILGGPNNEAIWCIAGYLPGGHGEMEANARLIAAAPELLAVAIKSHEPYVGLEEEDIRYLYGVKEADLAMALRAAIAKATQP